MGKALLFSIAVVFCVDIFITLAKEGGENDVIISQKHLSNHLKVDTSVNKESHFNASELKNARTDDCKCENGKCMRVCDVEKTTPCTDERKMCVCPPEFGKKGEGVCEYCDCGFGSNCTFTRNYFDIWSKTCNCGKGYFKDIYSEKCRAECSEERPCQNGGSCDWHNRCSCPNANRIRGDFCEEIAECSSKCLNRLEMDCHYDQDERIVYCSCKNSSLFYDQEARICTPCPCENGFCEYDFGYSDRKLMCLCHQGYKKFNGYCKECDCGSGSYCEFDSNGEKVCSCHEGFYEREGRCRICGCHGWSDMETKCEVTGNEKRCFCKDGFKDELGHCEDINECETNNTCPPSTRCYNMYGSFYCECPEGYRGTFGREIEPGQVCVDINECKESPSACWYYNNVRCVNIPGAYKCECEEGYEPISYTLEPHKTTCVETTKGQGPGTIVAITTLILVSVSLGLHIRLRKRALRSN